MFGKGTKIYSMFTGACPKCHGDHMYVNKNPYVLTETMKMHEHCGNCGFKYKVEPNFFFGAMYVSYGLAVMVGVAAFLVAHFIFNAGLPSAFASIFISLMLLMPIITRLARNIYINIFVNYDPHAGRANAKI